MCLEEEKGKGIASPQIVQYHWKVGLQLSPTATGLASFVYGTDIHISQLLLMYLSLGIASALIIFCSMMNY
jgi:hypothetical protein